MSMLTLLGLSLASPHARMSHHGAVRAAAQHFLDVAKAGFCNATQGRGDCYIDGSHGVLQMKKGAKRLATWREFAGACLLA